MQRLILPPSMNQCFDDASRLAGWDSVYDDELMDPAVRAVLLVAVDAAMLLRDMQPRGGDSTPSAARDKARAGLARLVRKAMWALEDQS